LAPVRKSGRARVLLRAQTDERLVSLVRAGSDEAFEAIVARYRPQLLRHCRILLRPDVAEDVVQQTFLNALEAMAADDRDLHLAAWLHRIAHNAAIDALRGPNAGSDQLDERLNAVPTPDQILDRRVGFRSVVASMQRLPERQRRAIVLRELEGRSYQEIAVAMAGSRSAVRQLLNRARNTLRAEGYGAERSARRRRRARLAPAGQCPGRRGRRRRRAQRGR
jgi:RNA polymerase sigma factor (sigma-70 family)